MNHPRPPGDPERLFREIEQARDTVLTRVRGLRPEVAAHRSEPGAWSVGEVIEHLVRAELYGIRGLWKAGEALRQHGPGAPLEPGLAERSIDEIFAGAPDRVDAPASVVPSQRGSPFGYWLARLRQNAGLQAQLAELLAGVEVGHIVLPHFIAGPLDGYQRLQFFRWHLERHLGQIERILASRAQSA